MSPMSESRLQVVMPSLSAKIYQLADLLALDPDPIILVVSAGFRSWAEQDSLYDQGRSLPGRIVTNAKGGESWHNYGVAVDCEPESKELAIDWNPSHPQWKRMETAGISLGLTSGATWTRLVDAPHFQLTGRFSEGAPDDEAREIYLTQGPQALWAEINRSGGIGDGRTQTTSSA